MDTRPSAPRVTLHCERIDPEESYRAWHLLRGAARRPDRSTSRSLKKYSGPRAGVLRGQSKER
jgi:hypothetical protein